MNNKEKPNSSKEAFEAKWKEIDYPYTDDYYALAETMWQAGREQLIKELRDEIKPIVDKLWFDPSDEGGACMACDANLHPNCMGKHQQLDGTPCAIQELKDILSKLNELGGEG